MSSPNEWSEEEKRITVREIERQERLMFDRWLDRVTGVPKQCWVDRDETGYGGEDQT